MSKKLKLETRINQFQDAKKRKWVVRLTVSSLRATRDLLAIDLNDALDPSKGVIDSLANDPLLMMDVIYLCCKKQMDERDIDADEFSDAIEGDVIAEASQALINAIIDFFPSSKTDIIRESLAIKDKMVARMKKKAMKSLSNVTEEQMEAAVQQLLKKSGPTSTPAPAS